jgi:hypothetical protein
MKDTLAQPYLNGKNCPPYYKKRTTPMEIIILQQEDLLRCLYAIKRHNNANKPFHCLIRFDYTLDALRELGYYYKYCPSKKYLFRWFDPRFYCVISSSPIQ